MELPAEIGKWLEIGTDGTVTVYTGKVEVGQNIRTSLAQAVAEELRVPLDQVQVVMGDTDRTPFDMGTFGSMTTPIMAAHLHRVAAAVLELALDRAASRWGVPRHEIIAAAGQIAHPASGWSVSLSELVGGERIMQAAAAGVAPTAAAQWTVAGVSVPKVNGEAMVTGRHRYASDIRRPGMRYGKILRPPALTATLLTLDTSAAEAMAGVQVVHEGSRIGVVAPNEHVAAAALAALRATWQTAPLPGEDDLYSYLRTHPAEPGTGFMDEPMLEEQGSPDEALAAAEHTLRHTYTAAPIAHAPLEPRAAVAEWQDGRLTVWTGTQRPFGVRGELALAFGLDEDDVRVIVPDTGSGYGGKHTGEVAREAACLARAAGVPVRLVWTREEEFTWAYMRPAGVFEIASAVQGDGTLTAWECHTYNAGTPGIRPPYTIPNQRLAFHPAQAPLRQGSYRALAATTNHFARETHIDEVAYSVGMDPLAFRLHNLRDARLRAVLQAAAERFGWGTEQAAVPGYGVGLAVGTEKGSYVAACAAVRVVGPERTVQVVRVVQAFECGAIVNPDGLRNQVEGAIVQALGGALFEHVEVAEGRVTTASFATYRVPRFTDVPPIETVLLDRKDLPAAGAGETPLITLAPAVGNAIFTATGIRLRSLPLARHGLAGATAG
jgi:isoquinoline 1-oxidoreductase